MIVSNARWACRSALALQTPSRVLAFSLVFAPLAVSSLSIGPHRRFVCSLIVNQGENHAIQFVTSSLSNRCSAATLFASLHAAIAHAEAPAPALSTYELAVRPALAPYFLAASRYCNAASACMTASSTFPCLPWSIAASRCAMPSLVCGLSLACIDTSACLSAFRRARQGRRSLPFFPVRSLLSFD